MRLSGAKIVVECLLEQGVDTVFGYPGVSIIRVYDQLYRKRGRIRHILTAHEQGAAHAADGYARSTGRVGVCLATSGPGATNLVTGMAAAFMDSSPVVFITCNVDSTLLGTDAFQEVDITGITMPITKCSYLVRTADELADTIRRAFALAVSGRPGPVLVDITYNATVETAEYTPVMPSAVPILPRVSADCVAAAAQMIREAKRPLILAGGGVIRSGAGDILRRLVHGHRLAAASTMMGLGAIPSRDPLFAGMAGMYGSPRAREAANLCDLLVAVGVRFSDRVAKDSGFASQAKIVHIDIDRAEIDKNVPADLSIVGDAGQVLTMLDHALDGYTAPPWLDLLPENKPGLSPAEEIIKIIQRLTGGSAGIVTDVGQHQLWTCRTYDFERPGQLITSGGYGAMGFGLGAAIGARAGSADCPVVLVTGDGSFRMNCTELATAKRYGLHVIIVIMNNSSLGLVRQQQSLHFGRRYSETSLGGAPDFTLLASAYGFEGVRVADSAEFETVFKRLLSAGQGGIIECNIDKDEMV